MKKTYFFAVVFVLILILSNKLSFAIDTNNPKDVLKITKADIASTMFNADYLSNDVTEQNGYLYNELILPFKNYSRFASSAGIYLYYFFKPEAAKKFFTKETSEFKKLSYRVVEEKGKIRTRYIYKYNKISKKGFFYIKRIHLTQTFCNGKDKKPCMEEKRVSEIYFKLLGNYYFEIDIGYPGIKSDDKLLQIESKKLYSIILNKLSGKQGGFTNPNNNITNTDLNVSISAKAQNFNPAVTEQDLNYNISQKGLNASTVKRIILHGEILSSNELNPIPNADIVIEFRKTKFRLRSDINGRYSKILSINPNGTKTIAIKINLYLEEQPENVMVKVLSKKFVADGRLQKLAIKLTQKNGKPAANKLYFINYKAFTHNGKKVKYITHPILSRTFKTNSKGFAVLLIETPKVIKSKLNNVVDAKKYFPVTAELIISKQKKVGSFNITFESPFPEIKRFLLPGGMDAQHWQITPSRIFIKDTDSNVFDIELRGYGKFKTKGGKIYSTLFHAFNRKGKIFEFYFASGKLGMDLNKQPQVWKEFMETNLRVAFSFLLAANEGSSFEKLRAIKSRVITNKVSYDTIYGTTKLGFGARDYNTAIQSFIHNTKKDYVSSQDVVVGGAFLTNDVVNLIKKSSSTLGESLQMELMKAIYENAKTTYNIYKKYRKIADSYRDIVFIPIYVRITDEDGYSTSIVKTIGIRLWKGVN